MAPKYTNVIVFGATGDVGRSAALEAHKRGAKVHLAMRDTSKSINPELDNAENFSRVKADLSDSSSVENAVETTGATAAFIYRVFTAEEKYTASLRALKDAGISWIVFLSSFTIKKGQDPRDVPQNQFIPYVHAVVEIQLEDLGIPHAALRPGNFASNSLRMNLNKSMNPPEAEVINGSFLTDCIVPLDIGRVGGAVLVDRPTDSTKEIIYLFGPDLFTTDEAWDILRENCPGAKDIKVLHPSMEEIIEKMVKKGFPEGVARSVVEQQGLSNGEDYYPDGHHAVGAGNVKKFSGYEPTGFKEYIATQQV